MKIALAAAILLAASVLPAATAPRDHGGHGGAAADTASTRDFKMAGDAMHKAMAIPYTGHADVDFVRGMIPHHQGAIDMARVVLKHGGDPETRKLAEEIIAAQEKEIAWMQDWLARNAR